MLSEKDRLEFSLARSFGEKRKERIERKERVFATVFLSSTAKFAQRRRRRRGGSVVSRHRYFFSRYLARTK